MVAPRTEPMAGAPGSSGGRPGAEGEAPPRSRPGEIPVALAIAAILTAVFVWWAWKEGAYFGGVFLPGAMLLYALLLLLLLAGPFNAKLSVAASVALAAILALAAWTLLSFVWTSFHDGAVQNAERAMLYAVAFSLGLWCCNLAGQRMTLPLAVMAATGAAIGIVVTVTLATGTDVSSYVHDDATLRFPIGYRNAEAAFLMICLWPTVVLAAEGRLQWYWNALLVAVATMLLDLTVLAQSRGSLPAAAVALLVLVALSPRRLRVASFLALAALPVLPALPALLDVFRHGREPGLLPYLRNASHAVALSSIGSMLLAAICIRGIERRLDLGPKRVRLLSRVVAAIAVVVVVVGGTVFVARRGGPIHFLDQRVSEFNRVGYPNLESQGTRFGANIGSNRHDFWRVALDQSSDHPLLGGGAGSFAAAYVQHRRSDETPRDPHSVEMLMLSELGVVGLLLLGAFVVGSASAGLRSRRLGPSAAALVAGSLTAGAYWLVHSSYDWFWLYPGVTAPAMFLLGAAAAPALLHRAAGLAPRARWAGVGALALVLIATVPLFLSQSYANRAYGESATNPSAAIDDLSRAASLDPWNPEPLLAKGLIESRLGRNAEAVSALRDGLERQPDSYAAHFFLARALAPTDLAAARAQAAEARSLNPLDPQSRDLYRRLQRAGRP